MNKTSETNSIATQRAGMWMNISDLLHPTGYALLPSWLPKETTSTLARSIGTIVDVWALLPGTDIPCVQTLQPRHRTTASFNQYSGTFGFNEFPFHTDLAHWARPPRYMMLRCKIGSPAVTTRLLQVSTIASTVGHETLRRAFVRPRRVERTGTLCLLPIVFCVDGVSGIRWDSLFLLPMNESANHVSRLLNSDTQQVSEAVTLCQTGDTLIIDNWSVLHGRGRVPMVDTSRRIERVYFSELHT